MKVWVRNSLILTVMVILGAIVFVWYVFNEKFTDTTKRKAHFTIDATELIREYEKNATAANVKYADKILIVSGIVSETETVDTSVNIKFSNEESGAYIIFAFQDQNIAEAKKIREGEKIKIKGSCSGGAYSEILESVFITFKRCVLN
ncbi:MAG: hypothetical protein WKF35_13170 [Ferruginibacter sp.]